MLAGLRLRRDAVQLAGSARCDPGATNKVEPGPLSVFTRAPGPVPKRARPRGGAGVAADARALDSHAAPSATGSDSAAQRS
jgi:hypothetical protein